MEYRYQTPEPVDINDKGQARTHLPEHADEVIDFISASKTNRQMSYQRIVETMRLGVSKECLQVALRNRGYKRHPALKRPPFSETTRRARLEWALANVQRTVEQWGNILWTDETWVHNQKHIKVRTISPAYFRVV